tara:strand:+ start:866 stop:1114 length:249 start_codon:yes stop_codon:yes gene_type:complete
MNHIKIDKSLPYHGQQISYKVTSTLQCILQLVKEYQPEKVIFTGSSRYNKLEDCSDVDTIVQVYLLLSEEHAMLFRLSVNYR